MTAKPPHQQRNRYQVVSQPALTRPALSLKLRTTADSGNGRRECRTALPTRNRGRAGWKAAAHAGRPTPGLTAYSRLALTGGAALFVVRQRWHCWRSTRSQDFATRLQSGVIGPAAAMKCTGARFSGAFRVAIGKTF
jgi:hypothetical protein